MNTIDPLRARSMKILFMNQVRGQLGGAERTILDLVQGLNDRGHDCDLAYGADARDSSAFSAPFRQTIRCAELAGDPPSADARPFSDILRETGADTVFIHNVARLPEGIETSCQARTIRMVHDVGLVCPTGLGYFRHGKCTCNYPAGWRCWLDLAFLGRGTSKFMPVTFNSIPDKLREMKRHMKLDGILTVSAYMQERLVANEFKREQIWVASPVRPLPKIPPPPPPTGSELLFVGTLQRGKGVDLLFGALQFVNEPFTLSIVGEGKSRAELERRCRDMGLEEKVMFHGWIDNSALRGFYQRALAVVVPTRAPESFCLIGPEAMYFGRPVVAFDAGGISSWLEHEHTGYLIPEQDVRAFAAALNRLLSDAALARDMGAEGAKRVRARFSFGKYLDRVEETLYGDPSTAGE